MKDCKTVVEVGKHTHLSSKDIQGKNLIFFYSEDNDRYGVQLDKTSLFVFCMDAHKYRDLRVLFGCFLQLFINFIFGDSLSVPEAR